MGRIKALKAVPSTQNVLNTINNYVLISPLVMRYLNFFQFN
jgi:hypothetical protein